VTVVSAMSDNAARATTRKLRELKHKEPKSPHGLSGVALKAAPEKLRHAAEAWLAMSEEQQEVAEGTQGLVELGCAGHSVNLAIEDSHKKSERESPVANAVHGLAVNVLRRPNERFARPKWNHGGIEDAFMRLPCFYSKIGALLRSPSDGGTFMLPFSAGEKGSWAQKKVQRKASACSMELFILLLRLRLSDIRENRQNRSLGVRGQALRVLFRDGFHGLAESLKNKE
jgi:hypothetical protein